MTHLGTRTHTHRRTNKIFAHTLLVDHHTTHTHTLQQRVKCDLVFANNGSVTNSLMVERQSHHDLDLTWWNCVHDSGVVVYETSQQLEA